MTPQPLQLRDIHLPPPVSWWPLAPGWWLVGALLIVTALLIIWLRRRWRQRAYRRTGLQQLHELELRHQQHPDSVPLAAELSRLLRHMAILHYPRHDCAGLEGDAWLRFLDQPFNDQPFSSGVGKALIDSPYRRDATLTNGQELIQLCRRWLQQLPTPRSGRRS